jgi:hypothetical protein
LHEAWKRDDRPARPDRHGRGPRQQRARVEDLSLSDRHRRVLRGGAHHNPAFFDASLPNNPAFITQDEESSGIIDAAHILGPGWFLLDVQAHKVSTDTELVEGGQLLAMFIDPDIASPFGDKHGHRHQNDDDDED